MKKITLIMVLVAALALVSCGKEEKGEEKKPVNTQVETKVDENDQATPETETELPDGEEIVADPPAEKPIEEKPISTPQKPEANKPTANPDSKPAETPKPTETPKPSEPQKPLEPIKPSTPQKDTRSLNEIMASILTGMGETPALGEIPLDAENFEFFAFAPYVEGVEALVSEPMMGSFAHSVVLVRLPDGADVEGFANQVRANANPRKWICVEAEKVKVSTKGNLVLLVMSSASNVDIISSNFLK